MQKWQIIYSSITGNTKQIAAAMYQALPPKQAALLTADEALCCDELDGDIIAVGYWVTRGGPDPVTSKLLAILTNKIVILFQTHGTTPGSEHSITSLARAAAQLGPNCFVLGTFSSQGRINPALIEKRLQQTDTANPHHPTPEKIAHWQAAAQHPDTDDLQRARDFIAAMLRKQRLLAKYKAETTASAPVNID